MRVGTLQVFRQSVSAMLDQQAKLYKTQNQLSTGKRMDSPSDNPTGAAQLIGLSESAKATAQYQKNISTAQSRLELEEGALGSVGDALLRVKELAVAGQNTTYGPQERAALALEVRQLAGEVMGLANRKLGNGQYMFAGYQVQTTPFSETAPGVFNYAGDQGQRLIQVGPARQIADGDSGQAVFMDIPDGGGGSESIFDTLETLASELEANVSNNNTLDQIDRAMEHMVGFRAVAGARLNALESQQGINDVVSLQLESTRSGIEDLDYAEAASRLSQESLVLQAAQQAIVKVQNLSLFNYI
jgi:flagellar hook-associated protein 3 FlgL